ncbi:MAG: amine dehydrogenase large subunit [Myxococcota bacterium]
MTAFILFYLNPAQAAEPLKPEPIPHVLKLPATYPASWVYAHDLEFNALLDGRVAIVDVAAETRPYKGHIGAGMMAGFLSAKTRPELYSAETFMSRRTYGERIDVLTIIDKRTLLPIEEILLPPRRMQVVPQKNAFQMTPDERWAFVMNFTPATSVTLVDLVQRTVLGEIPTPGCNFIFPTGQRSFSSLCSDGALVTLSLDASGALAKSTRTEPFIDIDTDPMFIKNAPSGGVHYFPTFKGRIQPIDFRSETPVVGEAWDLVEGEDAKASWAPGGWQVIDADARGRLYILMHAGAKEGSHKGGGTEVWVFDPGARKRLRRIKLKTPALSVAVTKGTSPWVVMTNAAMDLDVYAADTGGWKRTVHVNMGAHPFVVHAP